MGSQYEAKCIKCSHLCTISDGGGFTFHLIHCDKCGQEKSVPFDEIGELHLRYLKGLNVPYSMATREYDESVQKNYEGKPVSEEEYETGVEDMLEKCCCGGSFRFKAFPRCPKCGSDELEWDKSRPSVCYD